jgi:hypothetical protein
MRCSVAATWAIVSAGVSAGNLVLGTPTAFSVRHGALTAAAIPEYCCSSDQAPSLTANHERQPTRPDGSPVAVKGIEVPKGPTRRPIRQFTSRRRY